MGALLSVAVSVVSKATGTMFRGLMRVCCYAPSPTQPGGSSILARGPPVRRARRFKNVKLANNPDALCFCQLQDQTHIRTAGVVEGQQGIIEDCKACKIFIFGDCASVTVVNCSDCFICVASVDGSVTVRNCRSCQCSFCCRQFRAGNCGSCDVRLCCFTQPVMENCSNMQFGLVDKCTLDIADQVGPMKVSEWNKSSTDVYDFTPDPAATRHWTVLPEAARSTEAGEDEYYRQETCFVLFLEQDVALAYAYVIAAVWKVLCMVSVSRADNLNKPILTSFIHTLGLHDINDVRTWLQILSAAKIVILEIKGAGCSRTVQNAIQELGNDKSHFFMTNSAQRPDQANCWYYAGSPVGKEMCGSNCQLLLQRALQFADQ